MMVTVQSTNKAMPVGIMLVLALWWGGYWWEDSSLAMMIDDYYHPTPPGYHRFVQEGPFHTFAFNIVINGDSAVYRTLSAWGWVREPDQEP